MHIVHIASELAPIAKVGGLADVVLGLCRELSWKGHDVDIIIPKYDCLDSDQVRDFAVDTQDFLSFYNGEWHHNTVWMGWVENLKVYFIEPHHPRHFFNRGCFYGCEDDLERYLYFCRAAMEFMYKRPINPDILHLHDWQTAAICPLYADMYKELGFTKPKLVTTIHNMDYQGKCSPGDLDRIGLRGSKYFTADKLKDNVDPKLVNLLKGSFVYSDFVTTVSPNYSNEVKKAENGRGLEKTIVKYQNKFKGILNGVDYSYWNPELDRFLPTHFSTREVPLNKKDRNTFEKKAFVKRVLRERLNLAESYRPIVGCVARLVPQKGIEIIKHAISHTVEQGGQFVLLGSSPIPAIDAEFHGIKHQFVDNPNVSLNLHHQEDLAHLIFAGSDIFIVPSIFEPCGLTQLISLKYGTVPVVRRTGGLADTIFDVDNSGKPVEETNGYTFDLATNEAFDGALNRALTCWHDEPDRWRQLMHRGMEMDYSWNKPSNEYLAIYQDLIQ